MKSLNNYILIVLLITFASCGDSSSFSDPISDTDFANKSSDYVTSESIELEESNNSEREEKTKVDVTERKLLKTGEIVFESNDLSKTKTNITRALKKFDGYISVEREYSNNYKKSIFIEVRIPSNSFDSFLEESTKGIKVFDKKNVDVKDVTEEFLDVEARIKTKKELENRFIELLKMAKNVSEVLEIENEIGKLRSEIESIEGRLNYLKDRVGFSTLQISFYEKFESESEPESDFESAFKNGWSGLVSFIIVLINLWPFIIILGIILTILLIYRRKKK